jgi:O-glycosyl hydrolase
MWGRAHVLAGIAAAGMVCAQNAAAVNITLNTSTTYQTIEGFGAFGSITPWKIRQSVFYVDVDLVAVGFYDSLVTELGATMMRTNLDPEYTPDYNQVHVIPSGMRTRLQRLAALKAAAERNREPIRFIASVWSPPWRMKVSKCISKGSEINPDGLDCSTLNNTLDQALYLDEFAEHVSSWYAACRDTFGLPMYAISLQNEPAFDEPYASCNYYNGNNYNSMFRAVAPVVRADHPELKLFGVEHMGWAFPGWEDAIRADAVSAPQMHAWAIHGYYDGVQADTGSWQGSTPTDKPLWMSETSGSNYGVGPTDWNGAMTLARDILLYLRNAKISAWTWWSLQDLCDSGRPGCEATNAADYCLVINGVKTAKYYTSSHFYRFLRPGAVQVSSTSSDAEVRVVAFRHPTNNCISIVLHNSGSASKTVNVTGAGVSSFEMHTSTSASKRVRTDVGVSNITIPASSVVTLVNGTYRQTEPAVAIETPVSNLKAPVAGRTSSAQFYTLTGKLLPTTALRNAGATAVVIQRSASGAQNAVRAALHVK